MHKTFGFTDNTLASFRKMLVAAAVEYDLQYEVTFGPFPTSM
jgi:hypothetical protein